MRAFPALVVSAIGREACAVACAVQAASGRHFSDQDLYKDYSCTDHQAGGCVGDTAEDT